MHDDDLHSSVHMKKPLNLSMKMQEIKKKNLVLVNVWEYQ